MQRGQFTRVIPQDVENPPPLLNDGSLGDGGSSDPPLRGRRVRLPPPPPIWFDEYGPSGPPFPPPPLFLHGHPAHLGACLQQPDCRVECRRAQVHVALRRSQVLMSCQFLDSSCWRPTHRQVRTQRVPQDVHALLHVRRSRRSPNRDLHDILRHWFPPRCTRRVVPASVAVGVTPPPMVQWFERHLVARRIRISPPPIGPPARVCALRPSRPAGFRLQLRAMFNHEPPTQHQRIASPSTVSH